MIAGDAPDTVAIISQSLSLCCCSNRHINEVNQTKSNVMATSLQLLLHCTPAAAAAAAAATTTTTTTNSTNTNTRVGSVV